jgi:hypothetical protein
VFACMLRVCTCTLNARHASHPRRNTQTATLGSITSLTPPYGSIDGYDIVQVNGADLRESNVYQVRMFCCRSCF